MIRRQVVVPVSPERLWDALTDPDQVSGWFGARVEWRLEQGGPARFVTDDGREREGRVEAVRPGRHLRFRWWPAGGGADPAGDLSEVSYVLEPVEEGTRLTIQERQIAEPAVGGSGDAQACAAGASGSGAGASGSGWTDWDRRLVGAWAGVALPAHQLVRA
ncbi:MAG TPA: SRPBCC domain-containing protein [Acidimicrobiales bacterium]|jgi:uncharacterized protein YndB with AHSA1/START domain